MGTNLHDETRRLLLERPPSLSFRAIAEATDLGVEWIRKLAYDDSIDPGVKKVQRLHDYLVSQAAQLQTDTRAAS